MTLLPIETPNPLFGKYLYPEAKAIMELQQDVTWTAKEIPVENDVNDFRVTMSPSQLNLSQVTLQLFVEIEQDVGKVWEQISSWFPHSEIEGCCTEIARMEKSVHAFFYQKMSDVLNIEPETIAKNQQTITVLRDKLQFLKRIFSDLSAEKPLSLATIAFVEQVLLFSNFAMLKSYRANGYNLVPNTVTGVNFVTQDEQLHGRFAGYLFQTYLAEDKSTNTNKVNLPTLNANILAVLNEIISHEDAVIDYTFQDEPSINGITAAQLKSFIRSRANEALTLLGYPPIFEIDKNPIATWFYKGSTGIKMHDFFVSGTSQYRRSWKTENFSRSPYLGSTYE